MKRRIFITLLLALVFLVGLAAVVFFLSQEALKTAREEVEMKDEEINAEIKDGEKKGGEWKYAEKKNGGKKHRPSETKMKTDREDVGEDVPESAQGDIPVFPWPPPAASARVVVPDPFLRRRSPWLVRDAEQAIRYALDANGYLERSYFAVPDGFALVTRLESFYDDGRSKEGSARWVADVGPLRSFSLKEYLRALLSATPGHYRVIVFIVTPVPFSESKAKVSVDETPLWLNSGLNTLPVSIGEREYSPNHVCTALIYEFTQREQHGQAIENIPGRIPGDQHLVKAKIWPAFESRQTQTLQGGN